MNIQINPNPYVLPEGVDKFNYREVPNFWNGTHPLDAELKALSALVPMTGEADGAAVEVFRLAQNLYFDLWNNGAGNESRWNVRSQFAVAAMDAFSSIKGANIDLELNHRLCKVLLSMDVEEYFPINETETQYLVEVFMTDVVYYVTQYIKLNEQH